jgi:hypothetical protein
MSEYVNSKEGQILKILCIDLGYKLTNNVGDLTQQQVHFLLSAFKYKFGNNSFMDSVKEGYTEISFEDN